MEKRTIPFALLVAAAVSLLFLLLEAWSIDRSYIERAAEYSDDHRRAASDEMQRHCFRLPAVEAAECESQARNAAQQQQREEHDLSAQNRMALWTKWMGIAALVGMTVGIVGVVLLWSTFRATQNAALATAESARHAARAAKAAVDQHRAWLKVTDLSVVAIKFAKAEERAGKPEYIAAEVKVRIENVGATPATHVHWEPCIWPYAALDANIDNWAILWNRASSDFAERARAQSGYGFVIFPDDEPVELTHTANTLVWPVAGRMAISSSIDTPFRLFGVVAIIYEITSGDEGMTLVPFMMNVGEGELTFAKLAEKPVWIDDEIHTMRMAGAERTT